MSSEVAELRLQPWSFDSRNHVLIQASWLLAPLDVLGTFLQSSASVLQPSPENHSLLVSHVPMCTHIASFPVIPFLLSHHHPQWIMLLNTQDLTHIACQVMKSQWQPQRRGVIFLFTNLAGHYGKLSWVKCNRNGEGVWEPGHWEIQSWACHPPAGWP